MSLNVCIFVTTCQKTLLLMDGAPPSTAHSPSDALIIQIRALEGPLRRHLGVLRRSGEGRGQEVKHFDDVIGSRWRGRWR